MLLALDVTIYIQTVNTANKTHLLYYITIKILCKMLLLLLLIYFLQFFQSKTVNPLRSTVFNKFICVQAESVSVVPQSEQVPLQRFCVSVFLPAEF